MSPRSVLRLEGVAVFTAATATYFTLDAPLWLYLLLALAPDLSMLGYLAGARFGSRTYNAAHTFVAPIAIAGLGLLTATLPIVWVACIWAAHIGADRAVGYGLKYPTGFKHTHLSAAPVPRLPGADTIGDPGTPIPAGHDRR